MQILEFIRWFLGVSWDFFTEIKVPGFEFTFAALFVGLFLANLGLRFLFMVLGLGISSRDVVPIIERLNVKPKRRIGF